MSVQDGARGKAEFAPGRELVGNEPLWACTGEGTFEITDSDGARVLSVVPPPDCEDGAAVPSRMTFRDIRPTSRRSPGLPGSAARARVDIEGAPSLDAFRFRADQCDSAMRCTSPW